MALYTLECLQTHRKGEARWVERAKVYHSLEQAFEAAEQLWDDEEYFVESIRLKKTVTIATLTRDPQEESYLEEEATGCRDQDACAGRRFTQKGETPNG